MKAAVIGGGIIGGAVAWRLAAEGLEVQVFERAQLGQEASWAAAGMISPQVEAEGPGVFLDFCVRGRDAFWEVVARLVEESGVDPEYEDAGVLYVALNEVERAELVRRAQWQREAGLLVEELDGHAARVIEPALSPDVVGALRFPTDRPLENRRLTQAYANAALRRGARFHEGARVEEVLSDGRQVRGVRLSDGSVHEAEVVINAAGSWASEIRGLEDDRVRLIPVRGQMICFNARPGALRQGVFSQRAYLVQRRDGRVLAGSTFEEAGYNKSVTLAGMDKIASGARALMPGFEQLPFREAWAGLRPAAPDHMPIIGPSPSVAGVFYATGHFRSGILLSALTGNLIAAMVKGRRIEGDLGAFSPARFRTS